MFSPRCLKAAALGAIVSAGFALSATPAHAVLVYALNTNNQLYSFDSATPNSASLLGTINLAGSGATALGIDVRQDGTLYALGSNGNIYTLAGATGTLFSTAPAPSITGTNYTIDFNPVPNALRIINSNGQNLRITNSAGNNLATLNTDGTYPGTVSVSATSYTNTDTSTLTGTTQFIIDDLTDSLVEVAQPNTPQNAGALVNRGTLGVAVSGIVGFDVYYNLVSNTGYLAVGSSFYTVDVNSAGVVNNRASLVGTITGPAGASVGTIRGLSAQVAAAPEPGSLALLGLGGALGVAGIVRRRKRA